MSSIEDYCFRNEQKLQLYIGIQNSYNNSHKWCSYISAVQMLYHLEDTKNIIESNQTYLSHFYQKIQRKKKLATKFQDLAGDLINQEIPLEDNADVVEVFNRMLSKCAQIKDLFTFDLTTQDVFDSRTSQTEILTINPREDDIVNIISSSFTTESLQNDLDDNETETQAQTQTQTPGCSNFHSYFVIEIARSERDDNVNTDKINISLKFNQNGYNNQQTFELVGLIINHNVVASDGHYITVVKLNGKWVFFNDSHVTFQDNQFDYTSADYIARHATLLFYIKKPYDSTVDNTKYLDDYELRAPDNLLNTNPSPSSPNKKTIPIDIAHPINQTIINLNDFNHYIPSYTEEQKQQLKLTNHQIIDPDNTEQSIKSMQLSEQYKFLVGKLDVDDCNSIPFPIKSDLKSKEERIVNLLNWSCIIMQDPLFNFEAQEDDNKTLIINK